MLTKNDCILLLTEMQEDGINVTEQLKQLTINRNIPLEVIKFINDNKQLDVIAFYERLRVNHNHKRSPLYGNIVRDELKEPTKVLTTLASLNLQALLFAEKLGDPQLFLKHVRAKEISLVLAKYCTDYNLTDCFKLLRLIRADLMALEVAIERRQVK